MHSGRKQQTFVYLQRENQMLFCDIHSKCETILETISDFRLNALHDIKIFYQNVDCSDLIFVDYLRKRCLKSILATKDQIDTIEYLLVDLAHLPEYQCYCQNNIDVISQNKEFLKEIVKRYDDIMTILTS